MKIIVLDKPRIDLKMGVTETATYVKVNNLTIKKSEVKPDRVYFICGNSNENNLFVEDGTEAYCERGNWVSFAFSRLPQGQIFGVFVNQVLGIVGPAEGVDLDILEISDVPELSVTEVLLEKIITIYPAIKKPYVKRGLLRKLNPNESLSHLTAQCDLLTMILGKILSNLTEEQKTKILTDDVLTTMSALEEASILKVKSTQDCLSEIQKKKDLAEEIKKYREGLTS